MYKWNFEISIMQKTVTNNTKKIVKFTIVSFLTFWTMSVLILHEISKDEMIFKLEIHCYKNL